MRLATYRKAHSHCRTPDEGQMRGGELIMVKERAPFTKAEDVPGVALPLNNCSIWLHLRCPEIPIVRLTGVYFSPATKPKVEQVAVLTDDRSVVRHNGV